MKLIIFAAIVLALIFANIVGTGIADLVIRRRERKERERREFLDMLLDF